MANSYQTAVETPDFELLAELADNIVYRVPGCSDVMVRKTIQEVYRDFCRESQCLTAERHIKMVRDQNEYPLPSVMGGLLMAVREVKIDRVVLQEHRDYEVRGELLVLDPRFTNVPQRTDTETPDGAIVSYSPVAEWQTIEDRVLTIKTMEVPKINAESAPAWFIEKHGEAIVSGVLARLLSMVNKPWSDNQSAADERIRYENYKSEERMHHETAGLATCIDMSMTL